MERKREGKGSLGERVSTAVDSRTTVETEGFQPLSSRRDRLSTIDLIRTYDDSNSDFPEYLADEFKPRQPTSTYSHSVRDRSDSPGEKVNSGTIKTLQNRIRVLEVENRRMQETLRDVEETGKAEREVWKRRLLAEISVSKTRELDLISRFNSIERKLNIEEKRIKDAELVYKNSEAALLVRLEQTTADASTLEARLRKVESDYDDIHQEKSELERICAEKSEEIAQYKRELANLAAELKSAYAEIGSVRGESESFSASEQGKRQQIEEDNLKLSEELSAQKSRFQDSQREWTTTDEPFILKYLHDVPACKPKAAQKRGINKMKLPGEAKRASLSIQSESPKQSTMSSPRLSVEKLNDR